LAVDTVVFDAVLKNVYLGPIRDQLNSKKTIYGHLRKEDSDFGRQLVIPLRRGRNQGFGFISGTTGTVPAAGAQQYEDAFVPPKYFYGQVKIRQEVIEQSKSSAAAFARAVKTEMSGLPQDMANDLNRVVLGQSDCDLAQGGLSAYTGTSFTFTNASDARKCDVNMLLDFWNDAGTATDSTDDTLLHQGVPVTAVNLDTGVVTVSGVTLSGTAANIMVSRTGARSRDFRNEMAGLDNLIDNANPYLATSATVGNVQGINRTTNTWFNSVVFTAGANRSPSDTLLQQTIDAANIRAAGNIDCFVTTFGVRDAYEQTQVLLKRYPSTTNLPGGYSEDVDGGDFVKYAGIPIIPDKYAPQNKILALDKRYVYVARLADFDWMDSDGSILHLAGNNEPAYFANLYFFGELVVSKAAACAKLENITGTDAA
jgi:hypothetical protein